MKSNDSVHWLDRYGSGYHAWRELTHAGQQVYARPLGVLEQIFDTASGLTDGSTDIGFVLHLQLDARGEKLSEAAFRERVLLAWACLSARHPLMRARIIKVDSDQKTKIKTNCFAVTAGLSAAEIMAESAAALFFLDDYFVDVHEPTFNEHMVNTTARTVVPDQRLSKLYVFHPQPDTETGGQTLTVSFPHVHAILDAVTTHLRQTDFVRLLNLGRQELVHELTRATDPRAVWASLPAAQEGLYRHPVGNLARRRWYWAISRVLRHVRRPLPAAMRNPLFYENPDAVSPKRLHPLFDSLLDYSQGANEVRRGNERVVFSAAASDALQRICRQARVSPASGLFGLVALILMEMDEQRNPDVPLHQRRPVVSGFPIDARALCNFQGVPGSAVMAFGEGVVLHFLPSHLPVVGRLKLLARSAHRQLNVYQKRRFSKRMPQAGPQLQASSPATGPASSSAVAPVPAEAVGSSISSRSVAQLIPEMYLSGLEIVESLLPADQKTGITIQGGYPAAPAALSKTCVVSAVGSLIKLRLRHPGTGTGGSGAGVQKEEGGGEESSGLGANIQRMYILSRARHEEFLVAASYEDEGLNMSFIWDALQVDPERLQRWQTRCTHIFEHELIQAASKL